MAGQVVTVANQGAGKYGAVQVAVAATLLTAGSLTGEAATTAHLQMNSMGDRKNITIQNLGPNDIYIGLDAAVTSANGFKVPGNGGTFAADYGPKIAIYAVCPGGLQVTPNDTRLIEVY